MQKLKIFVLVLFVLALCVSGAFAQEKIIRWQEGTDYSDTLLVQGNTCRTVTSEGVTVLANIYYTDKLIRVDVLVDNKTEGRINVNPATISFNVIRPKIKNLKYKTPEDVAKSLGRTVTFANIFAGLGGGATKQTTATSVDQYGNTVNTTVTTPDYEARRRAEEQQQQNREAGQDAIAYLNSIVLRANTVFPGQQIIGAVFFEKEKNIDEGILSVLIGNTAFEFPYANREKK